MVLTGIPALAQDEAKRKIPFEIEERSPDEGTQPALSRSQHRMALGVAIDPFPTVISAVDRRFGLSVQPWFGIDNFKVRIDITHLRMPDALAGTRYFYKNDIDMGAVILEFFFSKNFEGFRIGSGFGIWDNSISHKYFTKKGGSISAFFTIGGGYVWKFYKTLYIEPCLALDILLSKETISIYGFKYRPLPLSGEISLKFGLYFDI
ncbi:MAG: hypothetical protein A2176_04335 [Spirochaetes bacterium RBG_13_51_14]|nr:MAG: hypothetical protein A2176_04335 [Spirochaetes bacterium RBG_13_51_14]